MFGPYAPAEGHRFNPNKLLIDPYAKAISGTIKWSNDLFAYKVGSEGEAFDTIVVLGIGGSALGASALLQALKPPHWNELSDEAREYFPRIYILDNVDPTTIGPLLDRLADAALDVAKTRGATYADLRVERLRSHVIVARDRELLATTLRTMGRAVTDRCATERLLHGEPHPGEPGEEGRRLIRLFAELSVSDVLQIPPTAGRLSSPAAE